MIKTELIDLIKTGRARVAVIGLGYVGLPLATEFASRGLNATGFDVDEKKVAEINAGRSYIGDVSSESIKGAVDAGRLHATTDFSELKQCDAIIICVPTPLRKTKEPDVSFILAAADEIKQRLRRGQLIIL
jgi:UDP-N-acetyl-D-glucosamine dehydrogenase